MIQFIHQSATLIFFWKPRSDCLKPLHSETAQLHTKWHWKSFTVQSQPPLLDSSAPCHIKHAIHFHLSVHFLRSLSEMCLFLHRETPPTFTAPFIWLSSVKSSQTSPDKNNLSVCYTWPPIACCTYIYHTEQTEWWNRTGELSQKIWV